jgi:site-specific DNA recombinase
MPRRRRAAVPQIDGPVRAVGYFRVSTEAQGERGVSLDVQLERFHAHCRRKGYTEAETFTDIASGTRTDRVEYQRMIRFIRDGGADVVVVMFFDRFGRDGREMLTRRWELSDLGVRIEATDERDEPDGSIMHYIRPWQAEQESRRIGERVRAAMARKFQSDPTFIAGRTPYGWRAIRELRPDGTIAKSIVIDEEEAEQVRWMAREFLHGATLRRLAVDLNARGVPVPARARHGWGITHVRTILARSLNAGLVRWGTTSNRAEAEPLTLPDRLPAILDAETQRQIDERLARQASMKGRAAGSPHLLSGLLQCGDCGGPMGIGYGGKSGEGRTRAYACLRNKSGHLKRSNYHNAKRLEAVILDELRADADAPIVPEPEPEPDSAAELARITAQLAKIDADFLASFRLFRDGVFADEAQFRAANADLAERRRQLETRRAQLAQLCADADAARARQAERPRQIHAFLDAFSHLSPAERRAELQRIVSRITVSPDRNVVISYV